MGSKLDVFNIGEKGVVLTPSALHRESGSLTKAQNAITDTNEEVGGLTKRGGLQKLNSSALAGTVSAFVDVPIANPATAVTKTMYAATQGEATNLWRTSTDGTTWANATSPAEAQQYDKTAGAGTDTFDSGGHVVTLRGKLYYAGDSYTQYPGGSHTAPPIRVFDGTNDLLLFKIPLDIKAGATSNVEYVGTMVAFEGKLYIGVNTDDHCRVIRYNPETGVIDQIGPSVPGDADGSRVVTAILGFQGRIWFGVSGNASVQKGTLYSIRSGVDTAWTTEYTASGDELIVSLASYNGKLYIGQTNTATAAGPKVIVRSAIGAYTTSTTGSWGASSGVGYIGGLFVYNSKMYGAYFDNDAGAFHYEMLELDGASWSSVYDVLTNQASVTDVGQAIEFKSNMYYVVPDPTNTIAVILKNVTGTWSEVETGSTGLRGFIGIVET